MEIHHQNQNTSQFLGRINDHSLIDVLCLSSRTILTGNRKHHRIWDPIVVHTLLLWKKTKIGQHHWAYTSNQSHRYFKRRIFRPDRNLFDITNSLRMNILCLSLKHSTLFIYKRYNWDYVEFWSWLSYFGNELENNYSSSLNEIGTA